MRYDYIAGAYDQITIDNTAGGIALTAANLSPSDGLYSGQKCERVIIQLESGQVRWRCDNGAPTAVLGIIMDIGDMIELDGHQNLRQFKAIRTDSPSGTLNVLYFYAV